MSSAWGAQTNVVRPEPSRTVTVFVPTKSTPVTVLFTPAPRMAKLCSSERSRTVIAYVPRGSDVTFLPDVVFSEIV